jgi:hypothetical protein
VVNNESTSLDPESWKINEALAKNTKSGNAQVLGEETQKPKRRWGMTIDLENLF